MSKRVVILMSTYNGEKFIREQINSILSQDYDNFHLLVRDDGSNDNTVSILSEFAQADGRVSFINKDHLENFGFNYSFITLIQEGLKREPDASFFAFADQDDVWFEHKISQAIEMIESNCEIISAPGNIVYYYANKQWTDEVLNPIHEDNMVYCRDDYFDMFMLPPVYGCTSIISKELAQKALEKRPVENLLYDVYIYRLACALGGRLIHDERTCMYYRRHGNNASGDAMQFSLIRGLKKYLAEPKSLHGIQKYTKAIYNNYADDMPLEQNKLCQLIIEYDRNIWKKLKLLVYPKAYQRGIKSSFMWVGRVLLNAI